MTDLLHLLENLAEGTWERIRDSHDLKVSQGEETISDLLLLELKRSKLPQIEVIKTSHADEALQGTDWEWWIGDNDAGWVRLSVQAKKIDINSLRYPGLKKRVGPAKRLQIDLLDQYSNHNNALPIYCLYNYLKIGDLQNYWNSYLPFSKEQLGCTITPSAVVRHAIENRGCKNFRSIHQDNRTFPWRCLAYRPPGLQSFEAASMGQPQYTLVNMFGGSLPIHQNLPVGFQEAIENNLPYHFDPEHYSEHIAIYPKRILVLNISAQKEDPEQNDQHMNVMSNNDNVE